MKKFVFNILGLFIAFGLGVLVMINGWGLNPVSWSWIIWGSIGSAFVGAVISLTGDEE